MIDFRLDINLPFECLKYRYYRQIADVDFKITSKKTANVFVSVYGFDSIVDTTINISKWFGKSYRYYFRIGLFGFNFELDVMSNEAIEVCRNGVVGKELI